jgi:hypothetical protein
MTPYQQPDHLAGRSFTELILGGDWACSQNQTATLADIARHLAHRVRAEERWRLLEIARLCDVDMAAATELWIDATDPVRDRCHAPGPRHDDPPGTRR